MRRDETIRVGVRDLARAELVQLAIIDDPIGVAELGFAQAEPLILLKIEHSVIGGRPGEPIHLAMPASLAAITVGQIELLVAEVFNPVERVMFESVRQRTIDRLGKDSK